MNLLRIKAPIASENSAAMAIHDECLYFIELDGNGEPLRKISVPLAEGCVVNGQIKSFPLLENAFAEIHRSLGKIHTPVNIGLPEGETRIIFPNFPDMSIEDIRGILDVNFSEYFPPYQRNETVFDVIKIQTPSDAHKTEITVLAVSARIQIVEHILQAARTAGIPVGAVEPLNFAMIRAIPEASEGLCLIADRHNIAAVWNGDGIYFRTGDTQQNFQDMQNTIRYIESQHRKGIQKIILLGPGFDFVDSGSESESGMRVITEPDEYYSARGLAMRDAPGVSSLDLRPQEIIEIERRRHSFSINRLALWILILAFFCFSGGTIAYTLMCIQEINDKIALVRTSVQDLTPQRIALTRQNSELEQQNAQTEKLLRFLQEDVPVLEILREFEANAGHGVKFDNADFSRTAPGGFTVTLDGKAEDERTVLAMTEGLKNGGKFSSIKLPVSQRDQTGRIIFKLILTMGEVSSES